MGLFPTDLFHPDPAASFFYAFLNGKTCFMGIEDRGKIVRTFSFLPDRSYKILNNGGEGVAVNIAGFFHSRIDLEKILLLLKAFEVETIVE